MANRLQQTIALQTKISPQQIQMIKLLELPTMQLEERIKREIEENIVLEEDTEAQQDNEEAPEKISVDDYIGKEDERTFKGALKINVVLNVGVSLVMAAVVITLSKWILQTYGPGFDTPSVLIYLALSTVFSSFASVVGMAIVSQGKTWIGLAFNMIWSLNFILFSSISLTHGAGATGVAFSLMMAYMLHGLFQFIYLWLSVLRNKE